MHRSRVRLSIVPLLATALVAMLVTPGRVIAADGATTCTAATGNFSAGELVVSAGWERGGRATVEGQPLALCYDSGAGYASASFQWVAIQAPILEPTFSTNIFQVGYGHCRNEWNDPAWGTTNCNGSMYWYFAWSSWCGSGPVTGSGGTHGAIPLRIGSALTSTPPTRDIYVLRENVGGTYYYDAYVGGALLQGVDATGNNRVARVPASSICWDSDSDTRSLAWFGETLNNADSMGGWRADGSYNHLDYTVLRYSINTGWLVPSLGAPNSHCNVEGTPSIYTCKIADNQHLYLDTLAR